MVRQLDEESRDQAVQWGWYLGLLDMLPGSRLLDVYCGDGGLTRLAVAFVGRQGMVVGVDSGAGALAEEGRRAADQHLGVVVRYVAGVGERLPFRDRAFDAVICVEGLGRAADPVGLIGECRRVCQPAGRVLLVQTDWDTQVHQSSLRDLTRRVVTAFSDSGTAGWGGRNLWGWFNSFPWANPRLEIYPHFNAEYLPSRSSWTLTRRTMRTPVLASGRVSAEEYDTWLADLEAQQAKGAYFFSINRYVCTGRIPPNL